jgi:hypothetical protein
MQTPDKKPKKKRSRQDLTTRAKILVAGIFLAFAVIAVGIPTLARLGWKANLVQQSCEAQVQEKADAVSKGPLATGNTIADTELGRAAALKTPQCQAAAAAHDTINKIVYWMFRTPILLVFLSALPWVYFMLRKINKF